MGGRGGKSNLTRPSAVPAPPMLQPQIQTQQPPISQQLPDDSNTPVQLDALDQLTGMPDAQLAQFFTDSQQTDLPNHLGDVNDITQKFVFAAGLNSKPEVLDAAEFKQFMADNNIPQSEILSRSINGGTLRTSTGSTRNLTAQQVADMAMYSRLNYIGGKHGGQAYGAGTYFDMNGGGNTGYASGMTLNAVLNPKTARVITDHALRAKAAAFDKSHPAFAKATGGYRTSFRNNNMSVYALVLGYNVIKDASGSYHNIIDRSALVYKK